MPAATRYAPAMGAEIPTVGHDPEATERFGRRLRRELDALALLLERRDFGAGEPSLGAELELYLIDDGAGPAHRNREVLEAAGDERLTVELARFNVEYNSDPSALAGSPFDDLAAQLTAALTAVDRAGAALGVRGVAIGILPTLDIAALAPGAMTDLPRYRALSEAIQGTRGEPFQIRIDGDEPLRAQASDVTLEGANTSLQLHLRVDPERFADTFNAAQLATPVALAACGNSPLFLGHKLWEETRIALFKQSTDLRPHGAADMRPARVCFGHGWVRRGIHELFAEAVYLHQPLLPLEEGDPDPVAEVEAGRLPRLAELKLHQGTVWRWNRPVYDPAGGGHLRIELRALPAGPSVIDMCANAAYLIGLTLGLRDRIAPLIAAMPFEYAKHNFYRAGQRGLAADLLWPTADGASPRPARAGELARRLLGVARDGLVGAGVEPWGVDRLLAIIDARLASGQTGARWQRALLSRLEPAEPRREALARLVETYVGYARANQPVHLWPIEAT